MVTALAGRTHRVITAFCVRGPTASAGFGVTTALCSVVLGVYRCTFNRVLVAADIVRDGDFSTKSRDLNSSPPSVYF